MIRTSLSPVDERSTLERDTLRLLCSVLIKPGTRIEICNLLDPSVFLDPLRSVLFDEIHGLGPISSQRLRELLPARIMNHGFPDFDLEDFLAPKAVSEEQMEALFQSAFKLLEISDPPN